MAFHISPAWRNISALAPYSAVGLAAIATMLLVPGSRGVIGAGLAILMLSIAIVDARQFIIPDRLVFVAIVLGLVGIGIDTGLDAVEMLIALVRGALMALVFGTLRGIYAKLRKREGMGLGDVKLAVVAGVWLDWMAIAGAIEMASLAALVVTGASIARGRPISGASPIPFGLYFAPAIWVTWLIAVSFMRLA